MTPIVLTSGWNVVRELIHQFEDAAATNPKDDAALIKQIQNHQGLVAAIKGARNIELAIGQPLAGSEVDRLLAALYNVATTPLPPESDFTANPALHNAFAGSESVTPPSAAVSAAVTGGQFQADTIDRYKQQERYYAPPVMRAKFQVASIERHKQEDGTISAMNLAMFAVSKQDGPYPQDGSDENNSFARWSPSAYLTISISNPALFSTFEEGQRYYADFTLAPDRSASVPPKSPAPEPPASDTPTPPPAAETAGPLDEPAPSGDPSGNPGAGPSVPEPVSSPSDSASAGAAPESAPPAAAPESSSAVNDGAKGEFFQAAAAPAGAELSIPRPR